LLLNFFKYFFLIVDPDLEISEIKLSKLLLCVVAKCIETWQTGRDLLWKKEPSGPEWGFSHA